MYVGGKDRKMSVRRVDDLGRIVIPKDIRKILHIKENDSVELIIEGDKVFIRKYIEQEICPCCGREKSEK